MSNPKMNLCIIMYQFHGNKIASDELLELGENMSSATFLRLKNFVRENRYALMVTIRKKNVFRVRCRRKKNIAPEYIVLSLHVDFYFFVKCARYF